MRHDNFIPDARVIRTHSRGRLPHWRVDDAVYFITFRLRDSIPRTIAKRLFEERKRMLQACTTTSERAQLDAAFAIKFDLELDRAHGRCLLRTHAQVAANAIRHFDGERYQLHAWCVMPNHVHVLLHVSRGDDVPTIVHSWKSFIAHQIGRGVIWQREYFDRIVRSPAELNQTREYIHANPIKAGLKAWPWVG
jgi:REP element-mobilizing transposase RayT